MPPFPVNFIDGIQTAIHETSEPMTSKEELIQKAQNGDIRSFHVLFSEFQPQLKSYIYRLMANRNEMEDLVQDVFILAFENVKSFKGEASLKSWVFTIATHEAFKVLKKKKRWREDTLLLVRDFAHRHDPIMESLERTHREDPFGKFEIKEHIDYCFTCLSRTLPLEQQVALILKDVYDFDVKETAQIMDKTPGVVKHLLHDARKMMVTVFDNQCALVSGTGACHQCSRLSGKFNPKQNAQEELMKIKLVQEARNQDKEKLYQLRMELVKAIDPLHGEGVNLHEVLLGIHHTVNDVAAND